MAKTKHLTYRKLATKLRELGYEDRVIEVGKKKAWVFDHPANPRATIYIQPMPLEDPVESMHLLAVKDTLLAHGLVERDPEQELLYLLDSDHNGLR